MQELFIIILHLTKQDITKQSKSTALRLRFIARLVFINCRH